MKKRILENMVDEALKAFMSQGEEYESYNQLIFRFPNDYGASVVYGPGTYGVELGKLFFDDDHKPDDVDYILTEEPTGYLESDELNTLLNEIKSIGG